MIARETSRQWKSSRSAGITNVSDSGVMIVGEKGTFYSSDDYCGVYELKGVDKVKVDYEKAEDKGNNDPEQHV